MDDKLGENATAERPVSAASATQLERLARIYGVLSAASPAADGTPGGGSAGGTTADDVALLRTACQTVCEVGGFRMAWAGLVDRESGSVKPAAVAGFEDGYLDFVQVRLEGERSEGPTGVAVRLRTTIVCDDIASDPRMRPWRDEALRRGYRSSAALPLIRGADLFGVLCVYADEPGRFDAAQVRLLEELTRNISFGLGAIDETSARKRAEAALAESEERFRRSLETMLDPFVILRAVRDDRGTIVDFKYDYANEAACVYNRLSRGELLGRSLLSLLPEHGHGLVEQYAHVVETGEPLVLDDLDYSDDWGGGRLERVFDIRASKLGDAIAYTWRDVTERRNAERRRSEELERRVLERTAELEAARQRALALADLSASMLEAADPSDVAARLLDTARRVSGALDGLVALVDPATEDIRFIGTLGHDEAALRRFTDMGSSTPSPIREVAKTGLPVVLEHRDELAARFPELASVVPVTDGRARVAFPLRAGNTSIGGLALGFEPRAFSPEELTFFLALANAAAHALERVRLGEAAREARGMLETVVAQMPVGVSIVTPSGGLLYRNAAFDAILGLENSSGTERPAAFRADGVELARPDWPGSRSLASGKGVSEEFSIRRADGSLAVIMQTAAPVRDRAGAVMSAVVVTLDVTERKEAEQLRDAFMGVLSHELRTPVTTIYGGAKMLASRGDRLDPTVRAELVADVAAESERLSRLVDDLLVLARAERGVDLTARSAALVQHRLRAVVEALASEWPSRRFSVEIPERVPPVVGDEAYLEQVLRNLIGNAAKYGRTEIVVRVETDAEAVVVNVLDDGPGIRPGDEDRIFELFWRAASARSLPGAGIGLFVARRLVEAMGGKLVVANRPGGGAAFTARLLPFPEPGE